MPGHGPPGSAHRARLGSTNSKHRSELPRRQDAAWMVQQADAQGSRPPHALRGQERPPCGGSRGGSGRTEMQGVLAWRWSGPVATAATLGSGHGHMPLSARTGAGRESSVIAISWPRQSRPTTTPGILKPHSEGALRRLPMTATSSTGHTSSAPIGPMTPVAAESSRPFET